MSNVKTSASNDYNSWRNRLIAIINKHGYNVNSVSGWTGTTVSVGESMTNQQMSNISKDMINTSIVLCHIPAFYSLDLGDYSVGKPTLLVTKTKIESKLAEMEAVCHHYATNPTHGTNGTQDTNSTCNCGDSGSCDTNCDCGHCGTGGVGTLGTYSGHSSGCTDVSATCSTCSVCSHSK